MNLLGAALTVALIVSACSASSRVDAPVSPLEVGELRAGSGVLNGYLMSKELPDSLSLLSPPPAEGSPGWAADMASAQAQTKLQATSRGALAVSDANLRFAEVAAVFSCALRVEISARRTPNLYMLLERSMTDIALATSKAKDAYKRPRPFMILKTQSCTPAEDASLVNEGSYPSGHAAIGWGWALMLSELAPDRSDALLRRGRAFSQSRGICGAHWKSDLEAGGLVGAATVARLHANSIFIAQMAAARHEIAKATVAGAPLTPACTAEATTIATSDALGP